MGLPLTDRTIDVLQKVSIEPQFVLEIDDVDTLYTATVIYKVVQIGDPDLEIGDEWMIGSFTPVANQSTTVSMSVTSTEINQQLNPDKGAISSVSSMKISLVDINDEITELITPGMVVDDLLGRRARVYLGFNGTSYPEDFVTIFRGIIDDIESEQGAVTLNIAHPDQKKRNTIFELTSTQLDGGIDNAVTTIDVVDASAYLVPVMGPDGLYDPMIEYYVRIDDEIIRYTGTTATTLTGCTRASFGTLADTHDDQADVNSFYRLTGNGVEMALKIMLSGWNGPYQEDVSATNFVRITVDDTVDNAIFFYNVDVRTRYGLNEGDYITTTGASNGANNVSLKRILTIESVQTGTYIVIDDVTFVEESDTTAVVDFRSQYDTLGEGLKMYGDEVDVDAHILWFNRYLSSFEFDFYLKDTVQAKEFIEKQIYLPMAAYSLPRKSQCSMGYHSGPIPGEKIVILNETNITNAHQLKLRRTMGKNFYNTIIYQYDVDSLTEQYFSGYIKTDATSKTRIPVGNKSLIIKADGMRRTLAGESLANENGTRLLNRYKYAAEFLDGVKVIFSEALAIEVGDIVLFDGTNLNISDTTNGVRGCPAKFYEVVNMKLNLKTGDATLNLVNTNFSTSSRYGLISPASLVDFGTSTTQFNIKQSYAGTYGVNEYRKWQRYIGCSVTVRNTDFSVSGTAIITAVSGNKITVGSSLGFTPAANYVMELSHYNNQTDIIKLLYTFMTDDATFDDGSSQYKMI